MKYPILMHWNYGWRKFVVVEEGVCKCCGRTTILKPLWSYIRHDDGTVTDHKAEDN